MYANPARKNLETTVKKLVYQSSVVDTEPESFGSVDPDAKFRVYSSFQEVKFLACTSGNDTD